ncbi:hypothetical protein ACYSNX_05895 [Myroides sp. LJL115]
MKDPMEVMDELAKEGLPYWDYQMPEQKNKYTKYMVYALLGVVFLIAMFFIFKPSSTTSVSSELVLPEPREVSMPEQKEKVYQMEAWLQKQRDAQSMGENTSGNYNSEKQFIEETTSNGLDYMQLASFYSEGVSAVTQELKEIYKKEQPLEPITSILAPNKQDLFDRVDYQMQNLAPSSAVDAFELMEKSVAMASALLPKDIGQMTENSVEKSTTVIKVAKIQRVENDPMDIVSTLSAKGQDRDTSGVVEVELPPFREEFFTPIGLETQIKRVKNTIKAVV